MTLYGYARISTAAQDLAGQVEQLKAAGCGEIVTEIGSGAQGRRRPRLKGLLLKLSAGDVLVTTELSRLARSAHDLLGIVARLTAAGVQLKSLREPWADATNPAGRLMTTVMAGLWEFEREMILARTSAGRAVARSRGGRLGGPPPKLTPAQRRYILEERQKARPTPFAQLTRVTGASRSTIARFMRQVRKGETFEIEPATPLEDAIARSAR